MPQSKTQVKKYHHRILSRLVVVYKARWSRWVPRKTFRRCHVIDSRNDKKNPIPHIKMSRKTKHLSALFLGEECSENSKTQFSKCYLQAPEFNASISELTKKLMIFLLLFLLIRIWSLCTIRQDSFLSVYSCIVYVERDENQWKSPNDLCCRRHTNHKKWLQMTRLI